MSGGLMQQQVRLGFRCRDDAGRAAVSGAVNTGVLIWGDPTDATAVAGLIPPTRMPVSDWCRVTTSDNDGTSFKFLRKGIFECHAVIEVTLFATQVSLQLSLDSANLLAAANSTSAVSRFIDYSSVTTAADSLASLKVMSSVSITNTLRGSSTYSVIAPATTSQVGTVRVHASQGGAALAAATISTGTMQFWCNGIAELFG